MRLSASGRAIAILATVLSFVVVIFLVRPRLGGSAAAYMFAAGVFGGLAGALWDRLTGSRPKAPRGRRIWNDPGVLEEETDARAGMFLVIGGLGLMWAAVLVALLVRGDYGLAALLAGMAVAAWLIVRGLARS